ncbi:ABC transporter substrate-binding protein [Paracoccus aminophilus]|uniref:Spermidine/putrescine transport system, substrate-binding protein n=1 Tax=Paracoccus aminophilus JCM 7686 TaxID=1367847 RepID=S5Y215_PARAH|nr:ABC transporter substrate-binding protein [Paracoccus aminophilus]AGT09780.1 spermidine/putrescine transport system, substrate-binding protein [Paracoccus aminophilus JCM 7686]
MKRVLTRCIAGLLLTTCPAFAEDVVTYASYGGAYQEAVRKAILDPIEKDTGMKIKDSAISAGITEVRTRVKGGANDLDVVELYGGQCQQAADEGLLVALDYGKLTNAAGVPKELQGKEWVGFTAYSTVIAWNKDVYGDHPPKDWKDFFDTENFPGTRAMSAYSGQTNLEAALMADGVAPDQLYPLDVERAFKKLDAFKPHVDVWWSSGSQATQLATSGESDMLTIWAARIEAAIKEGAPYDYTLNQGIMDVECLVIPKGSPNPEGAMKLVNLMLSPDYQANLPKYIPYGPMNADAFKSGKITPEEAARIITSDENRPKQVMINSAYWAEHGQKLQERWNAFLQ